MRRLFLLQNLLKKRQLACIISLLAWQHDDNKNLDSPYFTDNLNTPDNMSKNTHTKLFKLQFSGAIESFLLLAAFVEQDEDDILSKLNMKLAKESARATVIEKKKFKARFMKEVPDAVSFISSLLTIYNVGRPIVEAVLDKIS